MIDPGGCCYRMSGWFRGGRVGRGRGCDGYSGTEGQRQGATVGAGCGSYYWCRVVDVVAGPGSSCYVLGRITRYTFRCRGWCGGNSCSGPGCRHRSYGGRFGLNGGNVGYRGTSGWRIT